MITSYTLSFTTSHRTHEAGTAGKSVVIYSTIIPRVGEGVDYEGVSYDVQAVIYELRHNRLDKIHVRVI